MNLCDSNVWLSLTLSAHVHHRAARDWLDTTTEPRSALFCRATQQSLLRLLTTAAVLAPYGNPPLSNGEAWRILSIPAKKTTCSGGVYHKRCNRSLVN